MKKMWVNTMVLYIFCTSAINYFEPITGTLAAFPPEAQALRKIYKKYCGIPPHEAQGCINRLYKFVQQNLEPHEGSEFYICGPDTDVAQQTLCVALCLALPSPTKNILFSLMCNEGEFSDDLSIPITPKKVGPFDETMRYRPQVKFLYDSVQTFVTSYLESSTNTKINIYTDTIKFLLQTLRIFSITFLMIKPSKDMSPEDRERIDMLVRGINTRTEADALIEQLSDEFLSELDISPERIPVKASRSGQQARIILPFKLADAPRGWRHGKKP